MHTHCFWYAGLQCSSLEKPCIQRAQLSVFDPMNSYPFHQTGSNAELQLYHSFVEDQLVTPRSFTQKDVEKSLDIPLSRSSAFCLVTEVTPIQAWQQLCKYSEFGAIGTEEFRLLMDALLEHVRCYGSVPLP
jgi:hypothetical protein